MAELGKMEEVVREEFLLPLCAKKGLGESGSLSTRCTVGRGHFRSIGCLRMFRISMGCSLLRLFGSRGRSLSIDCSARTWCTGWLCKPKLCNEGLQTGQADEAGSSGWRWQWSEQLILKVSEVREPWPSTSSWMHPRRPRSSRRLTMLEDRDGGAVVPGPRATCIAHRRMDWGTSMPASNYYEGRPPAVDGFLRAAADAC